MRSFRDTSAIILSAGNSERMGKHKALLAFDKGTTFLQKITETYLLAGIEQVIVVVNSILFDTIKQGDYALSAKILLVINDKPELGRFYSLRTGIKYLLPGNFFFFQNIDNPYTSEALLRELILHKDEAEVIMPTFKGRTGHPVLINPSVIKEIIDARNSDLRIDLFLKRFGVIKVETSDKYILANINLPEEYQQLKSLRK
jgi:molybdenum cofactor cytidylyltransferase